MTITIKAQNNLYFCRACLKCIGKYFYSYFEKDFLHHACRFSRLNQEWEVKNRMKEH